MKQFSVCLFCGSRNGSVPEYVAHAEALGRGIAESGWQLVYGGGGVGLMGYTARAALNAGGRVVGIIPRALMDLELAHPDLNELIVTESMHERKKSMVDRSDAFVVLPGGFGTLDELCEVATWAQLGIHSKPIVLVNSGGFWKDFVDFTRSAAKAGFIPDAHLDLIRCVDTPEEALALIRAARS